MLRGEPGTHVEITVARDGDKDGTLTLALQRQMVRMPDVTLAALKDNKVGCASPRALPPPKRVRLPIVPAHLCVDAFPTGS